jgi:hypothetical protein
MAHRIRHLIFHCILAWTLTATAQAQNLPSLNPTDVDIEFTVFAPRAIKGVGYLPDTAARDPFKTVRFYNTYRSAVYSYRGAPTVRFYNESDVKAVIAARESATDKTQIPPPRPVAECIIPNGVKKAFLLFFPRPNAASGEPKYDIFVMDDGETRLPGGHFVIINASGIEMIGNVNGSDTVIGRGVSKPFAAQDGKVRLGMTRVERAYQSLVMADEWTLEPQQRNLVVMFPPMRGNLLPNLVRLNDEIPKTEKDIGLVSSRSLSSK